MAKKPEKKESKKDKPEVSMVMEYSRPKSVRIEKAANGFTVCSYGPKGETTMIAKTMPEVMKSAKKLLGSKK